MRRPEGHPFIASIMDTVMAPLDRIRVKVLPSVRGRVLEIGVGTGLNLPQYDPAHVTEVIGLEPDPHMRVRAARRAAEASVPVQIVSGRAEALPFDDESFDEVVITFAMCTIPDVPAALGEVKRVLRPAGVLHFAEHTRSDTRAMAWFQTAFDPIYTVFAAGCHLNRDPLAALQAAGFEVDDVHGHGRGPLNLAPIWRGRARRTGHP